MVKKRCKPVLDFKYGFGAMGFYPDHAKHMAFNTPFGLVIPIELG
jgi:hypothetical protein